MITKRWAGLAFALSLWAPAPARMPSLAVPFPVGSYDSDAYTLTFDTTGVFQYAKGDALMVRGKYAVRDSTVTLTDVQGPDACAAANLNPGTYRWHLTSGALWFRLVSDPCPDRVRGIADQAWQPHRRR